MNDSSSPAPRPEPHYYQIHVPVPTRGAVLGTVAVVLLLGVGAFAMWSGYQRHEADVQLTEAQQAFAPVADEVLQRSRAGLGQTETDLQNLSQSIDEGMAAKTSKAIDVNAFAAAQNGLGERLQQIDGELSGLDAKQAAAVTAHQLKPGTLLLSDAQQKDLSALHDRTSADITKTQALDPRIAALAQRRQTLALAEAAAQQKVAAQRARENSDAEEMQGEAVNQGPGQTVTYENGPAGAPVYYGPAYAPYDYPYGYGYYGPSVIIGGGWGWGGHFGGHGGHWRR